MANQDLNAIRAAIEERQGRRPRSAPGRRHRPGFRVGATPGGRPQYGRILATAFLTLAATVLTVTAAQMTQFWIGDHAKSHGREWAPLRALGFQPIGLPGNWGVKLAVLVEFRLLIWLILLAVLSAVLARPYQAVLIGLAAGLAPGNWPWHMPTLRFPDWVGTVLAKQDAWQRHGEPWREFAVFAVLALALTAWAEKTQAA